MDERIKEGMFLALAAFVAFWVVKGAMLDCGIWEMRGLFCGGPQRNLK